LDTISLCLIAKNEDEYLQEWIDYHILIGVERFYIYDNESQLPIRKLLKAYVNSGIVIVHEVKGTAQQLIAYQHCLDTYRESSKWMGFIDADEFIVLCKDNNLKDLLKKYDEFGGLAINSVFFGFGGQKQTPTGGQIINFQYRFPKEYDDNRLLKCIVQTKKAKIINSPHDLTCENPFYCVNSQGHRVDTQRFPVCYDEILINHYFTRSEDDFEKKINRLRVGGGQIEKEKLQKIYQIPQEKDLRIFEYLSRIIGVSVEYLSGFPQNDPFFKDFIHKRIALAKNKNITNADKENHILSEKFIPPNLELTEKVNQAKALQNWDAVKKYFLIYIKEFPSIVVNYTGYATTCIITEDLEEARNALEVAIGKFGKTYEILRVVSDYFVVTQQFSQAESCFYEMLKVGEEPDTLIRLTYVKIMQKKYLEAIEVGKRIIMDFWHSAELENEIAKNVVIDCIRLLNHYNRETEASDLITIIKNRFPEIETII
jgi:hypothetical protein